MKKVFSLLAIAAMFAAVACEPQDNPQKPDDNQPKDEYTGPVQGESQWSVIGSLSVDAVKMNWDADLVLAADGDLFVLKNLKIAAADEFKIRENKDWTNNRGGDLVELGKGFEVTNGGNNIKPAYEGLVDVWYNPAKEQMAVCEAGKAPAWTEAAQPQGGRITIDGDFADWAQLDAAMYKKATNDPDSPWEGVLEIRCYADPETVYYYIKFDSESLEDAFSLTPNDMHIRLCINTDGEFESGYANYFLDAYDFIIEGTIADGGAFVDFDGEFHQRIGSWVSLLAPENGLVCGKGAGVEYEIALDRATFNEAANTSTVPMPMGNTFETGIRFYYNGWEEFSNMPNSSIEEEAGNGWGYLMRITTVTD
ncbi:MAG: hypothetical protein J5675_01290 [Bacteroidales bacterium]|nr:hypothetical protein [Bacteroidales bacterium]